MEEKQADDMLATSEHPIMQVKEFIIIFLLYCYTAY